MQICIIWSTNYRSVWISHTNISIRGINIKVLKFSKIQYIWQYIYTSILLFSKSRCTFNTDSVSSQKYLWKSGTSLPFDRLAVHRYKCNFWYFLNWCCFKILQCFNINQFYCFLSNSALKASSWQISVIQLFRILFFKWI